MTRVIYWDDLGTGARRSVAEHFGTTAEEIDGLFGSDTRSSCQVPVGIAVYNDIFEFEGIYIYKSFYSDTKKYAKLFKSFNLLFGKSAKNTTFIMK